jgi:hypothetical protein
LEFEVLVDDRNLGHLEVDIVDRYGNRPVRVKFDQNGQVLYNEGVEDVPLGNYTKGKWHKISLSVEASPYGQYAIIFDDKIVKKNIPLAEAVKSVERISFRTGPYRDTPNRKTPNEDPVPPLPGADQKEAMGLFYIDNFTSR